MKGIVLAGGSGTRLRPFTSITSKQLMPVYDLPMVMYPIMTLKNCGIDDIMVITSPERRNDFESVLRCIMGDEVPKLDVQEHPDGIAQSLIIAEDFIGDDDVCLILGDNIFFNCDETFRETVSAKHYPCVMLKNVDDPERFGVATLKDREFVERIEEKPKVPKTNLAVTGIYFYDSRCVSIAKSLKPSHRGELEISDVNNAYAEDGSLRYRTIDGQWEDAGTFESLFRASEMARTFRRAR